MNKTATSILIVASLIGSQVGAAETVEAYIPFDSQSEAQAIVSGFPSMESSDTARLERMIFFNQGDANNLNPIPAAASADRSEAFALRHPMQNYGSKASDVSWADSNVINKFSIAEVVAMVPNQTPDLLTPSPITKVVDWSWSPDNPDVIVDNGSGQTFPNATYPEDQVGYGVTPYGEIVQINFWYDTHYSSAPYDVKLSPTGKNDLNIFNGRYYFSGMVDYYKSEWLLEVLDRLSKAYLYSGDSTYAAYVKAILVEYASRYRYMLGVRRTKADRMGSYVYNPLLDHIGSRMQLLQRFFRDTGYAVNVFHYQHLIEYYDRVYRDPIFNEPVAGDGRIARDYIENEYFVPAVQLEWDARPEGDVAGNIGDYGFNTMRAAIIMGRPDLARHGQFYMEFNNSSGPAGSDRLSIEGPGYHMNWRSNPARAAQLVYGYSDPEGYVDPDGFVMDQVDYRLPKNYARHYTSHQVYYYPDGRPNPIHDIQNFDPWVPKTTKSYVMGPIEHSITRVAPGFGHVLLGDGSDTEQVQAHLHFSSGGSHSQSDNLSLGMYAFGKETYGDPGYNWSTQGRSAVGHNTVIVDGDHNLSSSLGNIGNIHYVAPTLPGLKVVRVDHLEGSSYMDRFHRTLILNTTDTARPYVIDVFEAFGGDRHEWLVQGAMKEPMTASSSLSSSQLSAYDTAGGPDYLSHFTHMQMGSVRDETYVEMAYQDVTDQGVKIHIAHDQSEGLELIYGESPVYYDSATGAEGEPGLKTSKMILKNEGSDLNTVFVVVHEPYQLNTTHISSVEKTVIKEAGVPVELQLTVTFTDGRIDYHVLSLDSQERVDVDESRAMSLGPLSANASYAAAITAGSDCDVYMIGGTQADCMEKSITADHSMTTGQLISTQRSFDFDEYTDDGFVSNINLPTGDTLRDEMVFIDYLAADNSVKYTAGFEIKEIRSHAQGVFIAVHQDMNIIKDSGIWKQITPSDVIRESDNVRVRYVSANSSIPTARITPDLGRWYTERPTQTLPIYMDDIVVDTLHSDGEVQIGLGANPSGSFATNQTVDASSIATHAGTTVYAQANNPNGVYVQPVVKQHFRNAFSAQSPGAVLPGLFCEFSQGGGNVISHIDIPELGRSNSDNYVYKGYLDVPETGVYYFRYMAREAVLKISDVEVANSETDHLIPREVGVTLVAGQHAFEMKVYWDDTDDFNMRTSADFYLQWMKPGESIYVDVPPSAYSHRAVGNLPSITLSAEKDAVDHSIYTFSVTHSDDGSGSLIDAANMGWDMNNDGNTDFFGVASVTYPFPLPGEKTVTAIAFNDSGERVSESITVTVEGELPNTPPVVNDLTIPATGNVNETIHLRVSATDVDGDTLSYAWTNKTGGLGVVFSDQTLANPTVTFQQPGEYDIEVAVSDGTEVTTRNRTLSISDNSVASSQVVSEGSDSPAGGYVILTGGEGAQTRLREMIYTDSQQFVVGQTFSLPSVATGEQYQLKELYLKSASSENFDAYPGNVEIKLFTENQLGISLIKTFVYELNALGDGTSANEVNNGDWVRFSLDNGVLLPTSESYRFLVFFDRSSGSDNTHKWGWARDNSGIYNDGKQLEGRSNANPAYVAADWLTDPNNNVLELSNDDLMFYIGGDLVSADSDGDGLADAQEIALGTDPNDPTSKFSITSFAPLPTASTIQLTWPSATGIVYRVWQSADLTHWTVIRDWINALATPKDAVDVHLSPSNGFFKVEAQIQ